MYQEITLYDIKHNPFVIHNNLVNNAMTLQNDLYICVRGNSMDLPEDVKDVLRSLAKMISIYV